MHAACPETPAAYPKARAITSGVSKQGARLVFLLRLSPLVPFNLLNYALGECPGW
jgi:uncharacterized membrane protein YdjX (TVP38/TMEM64 family)